MVRKASKILVFTSSAVLLILLGAAGFTQTRLFKESLRSTLYKVVAANLNASVYIGEIRGNLVTGLSVDSVAVYVDGAPFVAARNVIVHYDPLPLWNKRVSVASVELDHPFVNLVRSTDGTWNVDRIAKKKSESDTTPSPWRISVKSLKITDARLRLFDSTAQSRTGLPDSVERTSVRFSDLDIRKLNVDLAAEVSSNEQSVVIRNISFESHREGFTLLGLSGSVTHTPTFSEVKDLLVATPSSHIELSAKATSVDVFRIHDVAALQFVPIQCSITSSTIDARDIQRFLPVLDFMRGSVIVDCTIDGEFGNVRVKHLDTRFNHSKVSLRGTVSNLHHPGDLTLNIESKGSVIQPTDVLALLPFFHIPDYGTAGPLAIDFQYVGKPLNFQTTARVSMAAGSVMVDGGLDLTGPVMSYRMKFGGEGLDLAKFYANPTRRSHLNFSGSVDGEGTSLDGLKARCEVTVDSSSFAGNHVSSLHAVISANQRKISMTDELSSPRGDLTSVALLDFTGGGAPSYSFNGRFSHVDLAELLGDERYASDFTFSLETHGRDFMTEKMGGRLAIEFGPSKFGSNEFDSAKAEVRLDADSSGRKSLRIISPIADVDAGGSFTYGSLLQTIRAHIGNLARGYRAQRAIFDTAFVAQAEPQQTTVDSSAAAVAPAMSSLRYSVRLKNLRPVAIFLGEDQFNAVGEISGSLEGTPDTLSADGSIRIHSAHYATKNRLLLAESLFVDYRVNRLSRDSIFALSESPSFSVKASAAHVLIGSSYFRNPSVELTLRNRKAEYSVSGEVDSTMKLGIDGRGTIGPSGYALSFDTFSLWYQGYELDMTKQFSSRFDRTGISIDSAIFVHQDERLTIGGGLTFGGALDGFARLENFSLSNIYHFGSSAEFKSNALAFGGTVNASVTMKGEARSPIIVGTLGAAGVAFRGAEFGSVTASLRYADQAVDVSVQLSKAPQPHDEYELLCVGTIPVNLAFDTVSNRFSTRGMDLTLKANDFDISIIDPFIAQLDQMKGFLAGSVHCTGSLDDPSFDGGMELKKWEFLFPMNNLYYHADGKVTFQGNRVLLTEVRAENMPEDYKSGSIQFGGYMTLKGVVPEEFHLTATGELMVLREARRTNELSVYGDLIAATGKEGLSFDGTYSSSRLTGSLFVKQASLTFPSTKETSSLVSSRGVNVVVVDDTSKPVRDTTALGPNLFAFLRPKNDARLTNESSFLDGLGYDLVIQTDGIVQIRMIFNAATNEELFADLNGKLGLSKEGNNVRLTGTISVSDKSKYEFYKEFVASGTLRFTGRPDNPELDIKATYTGSHLKPETGTQKESTVPSSEKVVVSLAITGTRIDPKVKIGLSTVDENGNETERTGDVESDAISFLLTSTPGSPGKFRDDLTSNDKQGIANSLGGSIGGSLISGFTNTLLSGMMMDFLRANSINAVSNIDIRYSGTSPDLRLSGVVGNAFWTFGGKVFNDINNANVSVQWSLGSLIQNESLRNFMFEVDRKVDPLETYDIRRPTSGARIYYRFAF